MLKLLGNLALVIGTVLGGIAAANSGRPWRALAIDADFAGQYLFDDVFLDEVTLGWEPAPPRAFELDAQAVPTDFSGETNAAGTLLEGPGYRYRIAERGAELTPELVKRLRAVGIDEIQVRHPALPAETIPTGEDGQAAVGRVLAEDVELGTKTEELPRERRVTMRLVRAASQGGLSELPLAGGPAGSMRIPATLPEDLDASLASAQAEIDGLAPLLDKALAEQVVAVRRSPLAQMDPTQVDAEAPSLPRGTRLTRQIVETLNDYAVASVKIAGSADSLALPRLQSSEEALASAAASELEPFIGHAKLGQSRTVEVPDIALAGTFIDAALGERLAQAGLSQVEVSIPSSFAFADWELRNGFLLALAAMVLGIVLKRSAPKDAREPSSSESAAATPSRISPKQLLTRIAESVNRLVENEQSLDVADLQPELDGLLEGDVADFVRGRDALRSSLGTSAFAEIFGPFSSAERKLARAWSAAVDDHIDEARSSLRDALPHLDQAIEQCGRGSA